MRIKVETLGFDTARRNVKIQVKLGGKWYDFGGMNFKEREELAIQLQKMAKELLK